MRSKTTATIILVTFSRNAALPRGAKSDNWWLISFGVEPATVSNHNSASCCHVRHNLVTSVLGNLRSYVSGRTILISEACSGAQRISPKMLRSSNVQSSTASAPDILFQGMYTGKNCDFVFVSLRSTRGVLISIEFVHQRGCSPRKQNTARTVLPATGHIPRRALLGCCKSFHCLRKYDEILLPSPWLPLWKQ